MGFLKKKYQVGYTITKSVLSPGKLVFQIFSFWSFKLAIKN